MNHIETFKEVLKKYHLFNPMPDIVKRQLFGAKKETLKHILKHKKEYSLTVKLVLSFLYTMKNLGFDLSYRESKVFTGTLSFAVTCVLLIGIFFLGKPYFMAPDYTEGIVICRIGDVYVTHPGEEKILLKVREAVRKGDIITTDDKSFVLIQIGNEKLLRIQPKSEVAVNSMLNSENNEFSLKLGTILSRLKKLRDNETYKIKSRTITASVRGTTFGVSCTKNNCTVTVKDGVVEVYQNTQNNKLIAKTGEAIVALKDMEKRPITKIENLEIKRIDAILYQDKTKNMTDSEVETFQELVIKNDAEIDKLITELIASSIPQTLEEIREKYGRIDTIHTFQGKIYRGSIMSRGARWKILVPGRYIFVPGRNVRYTK